MQLNLMIIVPNAMDDRLHRIILKIMPLQRFDEECRGDSELLETGQQKAKTLRPTVYIAPDERFGNRLKCGIGKGAGDTELSVDSNADLRLHGLRFAALITHRS